MVDAKWFASTIDTVEMKNVAGLEERKKYRGMINFLNLNR